MELRELPPGGREVQLLLGFHSPLGLSLGSLSWHAVRVGGQPACGQQLQGSLAALPALPILSEFGSGSGSSARQLQPRLGLKKLPLASEPGSVQLGRGQKGTQQQIWLPLFLSFSLFFLSVFKSHYMGLCSLGTSSSFQTCPGTSGAVTGMLRTRSVDYQDCTNERIQALLVSGGGIRHLPLQPVFPQHPQEPPSGRAGSFDCIEGPPTMKLSAPLWLTPAFHTMVSSASISLGLVEVGVPCREPNCS